MAGVPRGNAAGNAALHTVLPPRVDLNPHSFLHRHEGNANKDYRRIVNFVPKAAHKTDEEIELVDGLSIKLNHNQKLKLEAVTPAQWVAANACILADILVTERATLTPNYVLDYLAYTTKIGELATKFTWPSVMQYDDDYRALQHTYGFRWGSDTPHLSTINLEVRTKPKIAKKDGGRDINKPVCRCYNSSTCTFQPCRFKHVCMECGGDHPKSSHSKGDTVSKNL